MFDGYGPLGYRIIWIPRKRDADVTAVVPLRIAADEKADASHPARGSAEHDPFASVARPAVVVVAQLHCGGADVLPAGVAAPAVDVAPEATNGLLERRGRSAGGNSRSASPSISNT